MTVFKTFLKIVNKYKGTIILYTMMLLVFGVTNLNTKDTASFIETKPDVVIIDEDNSKLSNNLVNYMKKNTDLRSIKESDIDDALFFRDVVYVIYVPKNYQEKRLNQEDITLKIKSTNTYEGALSEEILKRYLESEKVYTKNYNNINTIIAKINNSLQSEVNVKTVSKIDTKEQSRISRYFNFASYSIMAVVIYIICLVLTSFKEKNVNKRIIISSTNYQEHNKLLLYSSFVYVFLIWLLYSILGVIIFKSEILNLKGIIYLGNTLIFSFVALTIALFISSVINNKNAISGIVNVFALGQAFLCGAFIPTEYLPDTVLKIAHILPSYYYINSNDILSKMEVVNLINLKPVIFNSIILLGISILFIILNNVVSRKKQIVG